MVESVTKTTKHVLSTIVFGCLLFEAQAPIRWQDNQVPHHASTYAKQLNQDIQALLP